MSQRIVVIGDSHTRALKTALADFQTNLDIRVHWLNLGKGASGKYGDLTVPEAEVLVESLAPNDLLAIGFIGAHHNAFGLHVDPEEPFDVYTPEEPEIDVPDGIRAIPYFQMRRYFLDFHSGPHPTLGLASRAKSKIVGIMPPPPKGDDEFVTRRLGSKIEGRTVNSAPRRRRVWQVERDAVLKLFGDRSMELLLPPQETYTTDRFLAPPYWYDDVAHANSDYGKHVLDQLVSRVEG